MRIMLVADVLHKENEAMRIVLVADVLRKENEAMRIVLVAGVLHYVGHQLITYYIMQVIN